MSEQKIPQGYKQTEIGVIPDDWDMKRLKEISPSQSVGLVINPSSYYSNLGTVPMLVGSQIFENKIKWATANKITVDSNSRLPASRLNQGDLVTVRVGDPGVTAVIPSELDQSNCASMMIIRQSKAFDSYWLCFLMNSRIGRSQIESVQYGTAQKQFNIVDAVDFLFPFPSKKEQTAIATALSDVDALICELEKIISKKQVIKTATMQQLLTGKTRLPQFALCEDGTKKGFKQSELGEIPEDWEVYLLSLICDVRDGTHDSPKYKDNGIPLVTSKNIVDDILDLSNVSLISPEDAFKIDKRSKVDKGDIIMSMIGTVGSAVLLLEDPEFCIKNVALFKPKKVLGEFLVQLIRSKNFQDYLEGSMDGGIQKFVSLGTLRNMEISLPSEQEQIATATILSDMDSEIQALEQRLVKTRQIKQGMMQELLTGKTRLLQGTVNT